MNEDKTFEIHKRKNREFIPASEVKEAIEKIHRCDKPNGCPDYDDYYCSSCYKKEFLLKELNLEDKTNKEQQPQYFSKVCIKCNKERKFRTGAINTESGMCGECFDWETERENEWEAEKRALMREECMGGGK